MGYGDQDSSQPGGLYTSTSLSLEEFLRRIYTFEKFPSGLIKSLVQAIQPADAGILYLYSEEQQYFTAHASYGYHCDNIQHNLLYREGLPGQCHRLRKTILLASTEEIANQMATLRPENLLCYDRMRQSLPPAFSMVAVPMVLREKILGTILLEHYRHHQPFKEKDIPQIEELIRWASLAVDNMKSCLELKQSKRSYRELLNKLLTASEDERKRIAREIHDEVNQLLLSIKVDLEKMESSLPDNLSEEREALKKSKSNINRIFDGLHSIVVSLRPPALDDLGLVQALEWYVQSYSEEKRLPITMNVTGLRHRRPAPVVETALYRIAQEALSNIIKHAGATSASVRLNFGKSRLVLEIKDNGKGFNSNSLLNTSDNRINLGLLGMKERAKLCGGSLNIDSAPGQGTSIKVEIPISSYDWGAY